MKEPRARIDGGEVEVTYRVPLAGDRPAPKRVPEPEPVARDRPSYSPGFRAVNWYGTMYHFTPTQARVVAQLWQAWQNGDGDGSVQQVILLEAADSDQQRLRDLFNRGDHPAWGTMIIAALDRGGSSGCYMLNAREDV